MSLMSASPRNEMQQPPDTRPPSTPRAGIVRTHPQTIRRATPHRTAESRFVAPTPMIAPVIVCVVLTGIPKRVASRMLIAPARLGAEAAHRDAAS